MSLLSKEEEGSSRCLSRSFLLVCVRAAMMEPAAQSTTDGCLSMACNTNVVQPELLAFFLLLQPQNKQPRGFFLVLINFHQNSILPGNWTVLLDQVSKKKSRASRVPLFVFFLWDHHVKLSFPFFFAFPPSAHKQLEIVLSIEI